MNSALQNRLVGTIIVVALVVILLPEILDGEKTQSNTEFVEIPESPPAMVIESAEQFPQQTLEDKTFRQAELVDETPLDEILEGDTEMSLQATLDPAVNEENADLPQTQENKAVTESSAQAIDVEEPDIEIEVKDSGWVVQLGSFRYEKNVNELIATLKQAGYRAYSRPVKTNMGVLNKVFVGPELERSRLEQALPHLQELTKLKGKITAFEVSAE